MMNWKIEHLLEKKDIMENEAFAKCSIFHNMFKSVQNLT